MAHSELHEAIKFFNYFVIWGGWAVWVFQIVRSGYFHCKKGGDTGLTILMHLFLFAANFLYVFYELQYSYIHLYFSMVFCTDLVGVWGVYLIIKNNGGVISTFETWLYRLTAIFLFATYLVAMYFPEKGVMCHQHYPLGLVIIVCFYVFWSAYVVHKIRDPEFLTPPKNITEDEIKALKEENEQLPTRQRKFDKFTMVKEQKKRFMFGTILCLIS